MTNIPIDGDRSDESAQVGMRAAWYGLGVLITAMVFSLVNLQMIYILAEQFKADLELTDTQVGAITGVALGAVTAIATYPMGWLADKVNRKILLAACVLIWSGSTAASGFSLEFVHLFAAVMGIAIGEAVLGPIVYSIIPDLFPENRRVLANYIFFAVSILGYSAGLVFSGALIDLIEAYRGAIALIPEDFDAWRITMIASALPGPAIAALVLLMRLKRKTPPAAGGDQAILPFFRDHLRTLFGVFIGFGLSFSAKSTMFIWAPPALIRVFGEGAADVGYRLGAVTAASSLGGVLASGAAYRYLKPKLGVLTAPRIAQYSLLVAGVSGLGLLVADNAALAYAILFVFGAGATAAMALSPTLMQDISPAAIRGRVIALGGICSLGFSAVTPLLVGVASDMLPDTSNALVVAMALIGVPALFLSVAIIRFGERTMPATVKAAGRSLPTTSPDG